ncbi:PucR family transcriptional regulator [Thermostaphylospora chromogena]|uniref:DNA-binding transcriptional regulator, PucR family n=1 Tax=Thermostaphylospora chromogena TaxID=35622 RepID=A0A1H1G0X3_9ACTN|nr:PucR family transcriptional regulator [Thermostaphylospora chromogena]SDR06719.1 DNA-binding transcriptional regulator, PucR family [Thermostaphylospora chromogena]
MRIRDLLGISELGLSVLVGEEHLDREFTSVHITDLPDPGRYLTGGELVLTGLMWYRGDPGDSEGFADVLRRAGVVAVGAGRARFGTVPDDLVRACAVRGLPLLAVPVETSFAAIAELAHVRHALDVRDALGRHRRIVAAVAEGAGLAELFTLMVRELGVSGAVVSATGSLIAGDVPAGLLPDLARAYLTAPRLPCPVRLDDRTYTIFAVGRTHRAAGWALACEGDLIERADVGYELAACVALERVRMEEGRRVERRLAAELVGAACAGGDPAELGARLRTCGIGATEPYAVLSAAAETDPEAGEADPAMLGGQIVEEALDRTVVAPAGAGDALAVVPLRGIGDDAGRLAALLGERTRALAAAARGLRISIGVSGVMSGPAGLRGGVEEARHARRLAEARGGGVVTSDEIYTHSLLLATVPDDIRRSFATRLLEPLFDYDKRHRSELVRTLGTFLECAGSWNLCAERLHVHVNTVRYRIRRVEELTGRDLSTMADRVDLFLALRAE